MAIVTRVTRLFRADVHAVLDRLEEPDVLLRQAIREMAEALAADRQRLRGLVREREQLEQRTAEIAHSLAAIEEDVAASFEAGRDDLARAAVRRRLEATRLAEVVERRRAGLAQQADALCRRCEDNATRLADLERKAELMGEEPGAGDEETVPQARPEVSVRDDEVELAFLREQRQRGRS